MNLDSLRQKLKTRFNDLDIVESFGRLVICNGGYLEMWHIKIDKLTLIFRSGYQLHDDLIILANEIRKEYYNVI